MGENAKPADRMTDYFNSIDFSKGANDLLRKFNIPGLTVAIVHNKAIESRAFGTSTFTSQTPVTAARSMTTQTLFDIGSASMSLTAAAVALLVADGQCPEVTYDAKMGKLLPGQFVMGRKGYEGITIEDILSHRTGMAPNNDAHIGFGPGVNDNAQTITLNVRNLPTAAPLRSRHMPCSLMYTVASYLVEYKTRMSFADFLDQRIFQPLGMSWSSLWLSRARQKGLGEHISPGYWWDPEAATYCCFHGVDSPAAQGAGSIVTNVDDYIKYIRAMMNQEPPFTEEVCRGLVRPRSIVSQDYATMHSFRSPTLCAFGWEVFHYRGCMVVAHCGRTAGSASTSFFVPALRFGAVIFANVESASVAGELLMQEFLDELLLVPQEYRLPREWRMQELFRSGLHDHALPYEASRKNGGEAACTGAEPSNCVAQQKIPLDTYVGEYWSPGWRGIKVEVDGEKKQLVIDCSNRLKGFKLTLEHVAAQTSYVAVKRYVTGGSGRAMRVEFRFEQCRARWVGIMLEPELDEYIWFERAV